MSRTFGRTATSKHAPRAVGVLVIAICLLAQGCEDRSSSHEEVEEAVLLPCPTGVEATSAASASQSVTRTSSDDIPLFAANSPFDVDYEPLAEEKEGKRMWAKSILWDEAPKLLVEKWLTEEPHTEGKCVLIEFWATWCPPCRKSVTLLNRLHERFGEELIVIGISDETEQAVRKLTDPKPEYFLAIDTQHRTKDVLEVRGIPHVIVVEPSGYVVWEGFPLLAGHELTEQEIERILKIAKDRQADAGTS